MRFVKTRTYVLTNEKGQWIGQVVLTSGGMFAATTDYGNLTYTWNHAGNDFRDFMAAISVHYFSRRLYSGLTYIAYGKKLEKACNRFAEMILPPLQKVLKEELASGKDWD